MFNLNLKNEDIIMSIDVFKTVTKKDVIFNFVGNLITQAGGDIANKVSLILSKNALYIVYKGHSAIGYAEETRDIKKILLSDITAISITSNKNEELIEIKTDKKYFFFVRDNSTNDNLALLMSKLINDIK